ncbi:DUF3445 domain-containing protein [Gracilibacillus oryzae]|uniref:DUF3445 domain-containing protein n=1 Tax=Gracilibacillus oryzae TaxID=1672701 RepID=A0A7C8GTJ6_9BACI|nr:DUF3445 domain-containing protein [Gracilibacillus oryzae]KAB8137457.1 DUF3445 domain-containing protein [Gracilibacillus oryzae]
MSALNEDTTHSSVSLITPEPLIKRFPFPFHEDSYRYSNNSRQLESGLCLEVTPEYEEEVEEKRALLKENHMKCYQSFSHTIEAQWEVLDMIIHELAEVYPDYFSIEKQGDQWTFSNHLLKEQYSFTFGAENTLPAEPLDFIGRHVQEDLVIVSQRDQDLYMDAGQVCFPANWSLVFDVGMTFTEWHSPVPVFSDKLAAKVRDFLMRMEAGKPWTRYNWTLTVEHVLPTFAEDFDLWAPKKDKVTKENIGELVHLRVEDQRLFRLPKSNSILFSIHSHLISLKELAENQVWLEHFRNIIDDLPEYIAEYKGFSEYKPLLSEWLTDTLQKQVEQGGNV